MKNRLSSSIGAALNERFDSDYDEYESERSRIQRKREGRRSHSDDPDHDEPQNLDQAISRFVFGKKEENPR